MIALAADIGGTKIAAARIGDDGQILGEVRVEPTPAREGSSAVIETTIRLLRRLGTTDAEAIGISSAGVVDTSTGEIIGSTDHIAGWRGSPVGSRVSSALGLPVTVIGDGHAFAVGAAAYGAAKDADSALLVVVGTGIAGSFVRQGEPLFGSHWAAGHVGHTPVPQADRLLCSCGRTGHLESIAGGSGMVRWYRHLGGSPEVATAEELFGCERADPLARRVIAGSATAIGRAVAGLANVLDPALAMVSGGMARASGSWRAMLRSAYAGTLMPVIAQTPLVIADTEEWLALRGAAHFARGIPHGR